MHHYKTLASIITPEAQSMPNDGRLISLNLSEFVDRYIDPHSAKTGWMDLSMWCCRYL
jgi:hypothetical protein